MPCALCPGPTADQDGRFSGMIGGTGGGYTWGLADEGIFGRCGDKISLDQREITSGCLSGPHADDVSGDQERRPRIDRHGAIASTYIHTDHLGTSVYLHRSSGDDSRLTATRLQAPRNEPRRKEKTADDIPRAILINLSRPHTKITLKL